MNTYADFIEAVQRVRDAVGPAPERTLKLTPYEYSRLCSLCAPVPANTAFPGTFNDVAIEIVPASCWGLSHMCAELHHKCRKAGACILTPPKG